MTTKVNLSKRAEAILAAEAKRQKKSKSDIIRSLLAGCETPARAKKNSAAADILPILRGENGGCETPKRITRTITITEVVEVA